MLCEKAENQYKSHSSKRFNSSLGLHWKGTHHFLKIHHVVNESLVALMCKSHICKESPPLATRQMIHWCYMKCYKTFGVNEREL